MLGIKINKNEKYLLACTCGASSMCLLDMLLKENVKPIICFVNYHKFGNNDADLELLQGFCEKQKLILEIHNVVEEANKDEDVYEWGRKIRYEFFKSVYLKYDASGLFVAHTEDSLLETYFVKNNKKKKANYGWDKVTEQDGMIVYRPLLNYSKKDILDYDEENHVSFSKETSSYEATFANDNSVKDSIAKLSDFERENIIKEMNGEAADKYEFIHGLQRKIEIGEELDVRELIALSFAGFVQTLSRFIGQVDEEIKVTPKLAKEIREMCLNPQENMSIKLSDTLYISKEYDVLSIGGNLETPLYSFTLQKPGKMNTEYFEMDFSNGAMDRGFRLSDYPLTIRPATPTDLFNVHGFMTPIRKLYYDWRMPPKKKVIWPVIANKYGEIIYIPRYHRLHRTDHTSKFEIKFDEDN